MTTSSQYPQEPQEILGATPGSKLGNPRARSLHLPDLFEEFLVRIHGKLSLRRAILFIAHTNPSRLISLAMWNRGTLSAGVAITIPGEDSLLAELVEANCAKIYSPVADCPGNFVESRLLLDHPGGALAIYPLVAESNPVGVICLVSDDENAFFGENIFLKNAIKLFSELTRDNLSDYEKLS